MLVLSFCRFEIVSLQQFIDDSIGGITAPLLPFRFNYHDYFRFLHFVLPRRLRDEFGRVSVFFEDL